MNQPSDASWIRLSSWRTTRYRGMLPLGFLSFFGLCLPFLSDPLGVESSQQGSPSLAEEDTVRILEEYKRAHLLAPDRSPWWAPPRGRIHDRIEVEFEDLTVLGKRVILRLDRAFWSARRDRNPRFVRWMKAVRMSGCADSTRQSFKLVSGHLEHYLLNRMSKNTRYTE